MNIFLVECFLDVKKILPTYNLIRLIIHYIHFCVKLFHLDEPTISFSEIKNVSIQLSKISSEDLQIAIKSKY